jgi:hypothetical protein
VATEPLDPAGNLVVRVVDGVDQVTDGIRVGGIDRVDVGGRDAPRIVLVGSYVFSMGDR